MSSGSRVPEVFLPSESSTITDGSRRTPLPSAFGTGVRAANSPRSSPSPIAVPPSATSWSSAPLICGAVGRRGDALLGEVRERDQAEPERRRDLLGQRLGRGDGGAQAVGLDVGGVHRARDVGDHHDVGGALWRGHGALRPGERDDQRGQREQQQQRRQMPAPAGLRGRQVRARARGSPTPPTRAAGAAAASRRPAARAATG